MSEGGVDEDADIKDDDLHQSQSKKNARERTSASPCHSSFQSTYSGWLHDSAVQPCTTLPCSQRQMKA